MSLEELKRHPSGVDVPIGGQVMQPAPLGAAGRFELLPDDVADELARFLAVDPVPGHFRRDGKTYTHLLATRRMRDLFNSNGRYLRTVRKRTPYNPAYMHPEDLAARGLAVGDRIELVSAAGRAAAIVGEDRDVKPGVILIAHGWGWLAGKRRSCRRGSGGKRAD